MGSIAIVGLEPDATGMPDERAVERIRAARSVVVPSGSGASAATLRSLGITPLDFPGIGLEERAGAVEVVEALLRLAAEGDVVFVSAGYPFVREGLLSAVLARSHRPVDVFPVASPLQVLMLALDVDATADLEIVDAGRLAGLPLRRDTHLIVTGIDNVLQARAAATHLGAFYPPEHTAVAASCLDQGGFELTPVSLSDLARIPSVRRDTALYLSPSRIAPPGGFAELVRTIAVLRSPDGCPWDREQTHASLAPYLVEEAYEAVSAIEAGEPSAIADELGDVLLQVVLNAQIGADEGTFDIDDVIAAIITKIRRRHPHVFGSTSVDSAEEVTRVWDAIKREEKAADIAGGGTLAGVPSALPALMRAQKISRRAAAAGFEWEDLDGVWAKVHEEIDELKAADPGSPDAAEELGDLLFTVVNVARKMGIDSETALRGTCDKFIRRFEAMERAAGTDGHALDTLDAEGWDRYWEHAKRSEREAPAAGED